MGFTPKANDVHKYTKGRPFYILWNPDSEKPPAVTFRDKEEAVRMAETMTVKYGHIFYVMEAKVRVGDVPEPKVCVTELSEEPPKVIDYKHTVTVKDLEAKLEIIRKLAREARARQTKKANRKH